MGSIYHLVWHWGWCMSLQWFLQTIWYYEIHWIPDNLVTCFFLYHYHAYTYVISYTNNAALVIVPYHFHYYAAVNIFWKLAKLLICLWSFFQILVWISVFLQLAIVYRDLKKEEDMFETLTRISQLSETPSAGFSRNRTSSVLGSLRRLKYHFTKANDSSRTSKSTTQGATSSARSSQRKVPDEQNAIETRSRSPFVNKRSQIDGLRHADRRSVSVDALKETTSLAKSPSPPPKASNATAWREAWTLSNTEVSIPQLCAVSQCELNRLCTSCSEMLPQPIL